MVPHYRKLYNPNPREGVKGVQMKFPAIFQEYTDLINQKLLEVFEKDDPAMRDLTVYHIQAGGKRARPILSMLTCQGLGGTLDDVMPYALTLEILHNVSLIYDDMIDGAHLRRGKKPLHVQYGVKNALIAANYVTWRALEIFSEEVTPAALKELALAVRMTSFGEKLDIDFSRLSEEDYMRVCENKTSYQFQISAYLGALAATDKPEILEHSKRFGKNLGFAFQIRDDVLNVIGKEKESGKDVGTDYLRTRPNFVIVKAYQNLGDELYEGDIMDKIQSSGALDEATQAAEYYLEQSREFLSMFTVDKYRDMLDMMIQFIVKRTL
jgi:geranylgeranyl diphosphate synthase type I